MILFFSFSFLFKKFFYFGHITRHVGGCPGGASCKKPACRCRRRNRYGFDPWVVKIPRGGRGNPLQYSCLEDPTDRGAWWATVHRVAPSRAQLKRLGTHVSRGTLSPQPGLNLGLMMESQPLYCQGIPLVFFVIWIFRAFTFTAKLCPRGRYRGFLSASHTRTASLPSASPRDGPFVTSDEHAWTHGHHPEPMVYVRAHSWCLTFGQMYHNGMCSPL